MRTHLFLLVPAHGHVNPTLAVAERLGADGHEVVYLLPETFRDAVECVGARFVPFPTGPGCESPAGATRQLFDVPGLFDIAERIVDTLLVLHDDIGPDLVVTEPMAIWGRMLAEARNQAVALLSSSYAPPPGSPLAARLAQHTANAMEDPRVRMRLHSVEERFGHGVHQWAWRPAALTVAFMTREFHPEQEQLAGDVHFVGPSLGRPETGTVTVADGAVYVSLGTLFNRKPDFFRACVTAFGGDGRPPVVVHHGARVAARDIGPVPGNVLLATHVPQLSVLARSRAFVTHGGMNSVMEALACDVPLVVVPQMVEQEITADRVVELGLGRRLNLADATPDRLAAEVHTVTTDPATLAAVRRMGAACRAAGGARATATLLEEAAGGRRASPAAGPRIAPPG